MGCLMAAENTEAYGAPWRSWETPTEKDVFVDGYLG